MDRIEAARARSQGYNLLSALIARGLTVEMMPALQQVAAVAGALPERYDADEAAAEHYALFGRTVFAYASVFCSRAAQRGGEEVARVLVTYAACGFAPPDALEADGLACELAALAYLCAAEADALEDGLAAEVHKSRTHQAQLLADHLLGWLPAICEALQRQPQPLYAVAGALLCGFVGDHAAPFAPEFVPRSAVTLIPAPDPADSSTRLAEIADWLLAPVCTGYLLTRDDLHRVAAAPGIPTGFADRRNTLMDLLRAAGARDALPALLNLLDERVAQASAAYAMMADENPLLEPWVSAWMERTANTHNLLAAMRKVSNIREMPE